MCTKFRNICRENPLTEQDYTYQSRSSIMVSCMQPCLAENRSNTLRWKLNPKVDVRLILFERRYYEDILLCVDNQSGQARNCSQSVFSNYALLFITNNQCCGASRVHQLSITLIVYLFYWLNLRIDQCIEYIDALSIMLYNSWFTFTI